MKTKNRIKIVLGISMVSILFLTCGKPTKGVAKPKLGIVISTLNNPFFVELRDGAVKAANEAGYDITVLDSQDDVSKELNNIEDLISSKVGVILINPTDSESSARAARLVLDAKIPLITLDRNINGIDVITHVASDNAAGGEMAALYLMAIVPNGKIMELEGIPGTSAARERGRGFNEALKSASREVFVKQTANFDRAQGLSVTENLLQVNPDIKVIFAHNDEMALGALRAVEAANLDIKIIGFDATPDAVTSVSDGKLAATVAQQPILIGSLGVENAVKTLNGEQVPKNIPVDLKLITK